MKRTRTINLVIMAPVSVTLTVTTDHDDAEPSDWQIKKVETDRPSLSIRDVEERVFDDPDMLDEWNKAVEAAEDE